MKKYRSLSVVLTPRRRFAVTLCLLALLVSTNRWHDKDTAAGFEKLTSSDSSTYYALATAAPALPDPATLDSKPVHHQAQRLFFPFASGLLSKLLGIPIVSVFRLLLLAAIVTILLALHRVFQHLKLPTGLYLLGMGVVLFNPFSIRYYILYPLMANDVVFSASVAWLLVGLLKRQLSITLISIAVASLARQTSLLLLPAISLWALLGDRFKVSRNWRDHTLVLCCAAVAIIIYLGTGKIVKPFAQDSRNLLHLYGLFPWLTQSFEMYMLAQFLVRNAIGYVLPASLLLAALVSRKNLGQELIPRTKEFWLLVIMCGSVSIQPLLSGPDLSPYTSTIRLSMLGYIPFLVAVTMYLDTGRMFERPTVLQLCLVGVLLLVCSFHHLYTVFETELIGARAFVAIYIVSALAIGCLIFNFSSGSGRPEA